MKILAIDTSCDETAAAVTEGRKVLSNAVYSQILTHKKWGGVVPSLAKRAHQERIGLVIEDAFKKAKLTMEDIGAIAVTQGPGLAIALEVGIATAKELSAKHSKPLIAVNHLEGHIYSPFVQNSKGSPKVEIAFPYLVLLVSGAHTELVIFKDHLTYDVIGKTKDDAGGEAIDKAARMLGFSYPGGPVLERLAQEVNNEDMYKFPRPMAKSQDLDFSFSGLKTAFLYHLRSMSEEEKVEKMRYLASSFQTAVFDSLLIKTKAAMKKTGINNLILAGGVAANMRLRQLMRELIKDEGSVLFPHYKYLNGDNAAMIGVVASYKAERGIFANPSSVDRIPRMSL